MANEFIDPKWLLPVFYFQVEIAGQKALFREVSGLDMEAQSIEYRHGNSPAFSTINMPGIKKHSNVMLKKGVFAANNAFLHWCDQVKSNTVERQSVSICLLDEAGNRTMKWMLHNAWPTKISGIAIRADEQEMIVETLELAHEGLTISND